MSNQRAAQLSRDKKKQQRQALESRLASLQEQNAQMAQQFSLLKQENELLRQSIATFCHRAHPSPPSASSSSVSSLSAPASAAADVKSQIIAPEQGQGQDTKILSSPSSPPSSSPSSPSSPPLPALLSSVAGNCKSAALAAVSQASLLRKFSVRRQQQASLLLQAILKLSSLMMALQISLPHPLFFHAPPSSSLHLSWHPSRKSWAAASPRFHLHHRLHHHPFSSKLIPPLLSLPAPFPPLASSETGMRTHLSSKQPLLSLSSPPTTTLIVNRNSPHSPRVVTSHQQTRHLLFHACRLSEAIHLYAARHFPPQSHLRLIVDHLLDRCSFQVSKKSAC